MSVSIGPEASVLRILKDIVGIIISAMITGALFLGAPIIGVIISFLPRDFVDVLATPEQHAVYFDGAYVLSPVEVDGELDGVEQEPVAEPDDPEEKVPDEPEGTESDKGPVDPKSKADNAGADIVVDGPKSKVGTAAGSSKGEGVARRQPGTRHPKGAAQKKSRRQCPRTFEGIRRRPDGIYEVSRKLVNYHTSSVKRFNELGWSKNNDTGDKKGWYVNGFGCKDPLWHGGIRRGDIVMTVNGKKTNNMLQILMLYQKVKTRKHFEVVVRRKGKRITLKYELVKG